MHIDLSDKTIVMTGALGAIAEYVVRTLLDAEAFVVLTDRVEEHEARVAMESRGYASRRCDYYRMDVTDAPAVSHVVDEIFQLYPNVNIALGHAGGTGIEKFRDSSTDSFDGLVQFNFLGQTYFARAVLEQWLKRETQGHMVFTSSYVSRIPFAGIAAYNASKAALDMFAKTLALEYASDGIRFNVVSPGNVAAGASLVVYESDPEYRATVDRMSPLRKRNSPQAVANAFLYLCSSLADEVDGHILNVDAGVGLPKIN